MLSKIKYGVAVINKWKTHLTRGYHSHIAVSHLFDSLSDFTLANNPNYHVAALQKSDL